MRLLNKSLYLRVRCCKRWKSELVWQPAERKAMSTNLKPEETFSTEKIGTFFQEKPQLGNQYLEDKTLQSYLKRFIDPNQFETVNKDLVRFGDRVTSEIADLGQQCEQEKPYLEQYDAWGNRVDKLVTCSAWKKLHGICAEEGIISTAYNQSNGPTRRLWQMAKVYLFAPVSGLYSCPIAMTDGAAKICQSIYSTYPVLEQPYSHLTSRDPEQFWTSGQWMTERQGGSDVANGTETYAVPQSDGTFKLYGYKWFSSATDADMTFTLARVTDENGSSIAGTKGLSLFYLQVRGDDGNLNNIQIQKLKNKLGTRQLPTAELLLHGSIAHKVSDEGRGVIAITNMLKLTRIHNSMAAVSSMRRMINMARDYSTRRVAFRKKLKDYPLHVHTLAQMEIEVRGGTLLTFECVRLLGREDEGIASEEEKLLLRFLTPLCKLYTAKQAMSVLSEGVESFGGQGYIEDTGIPALLRDGQVLPIWEGTTNVLSLDVLRAILKSNKAAMTVWQSDVTNKLSCVHCGREKHPLTESRNRVKVAVEKIIQFQENNQHLLEMAARDFAFSLTRTYIGAILIEHAVECGMAPTDVHAAIRWCDKDLTPVVTNKESYSNSDSQMEYRIVFENYHDASRL